MLEELHVARLGVIEDATLALAPGLNVLTGETGAGKTLLTVGLALALGARSAQGLVRAGERDLAVEARFRLDRLGPELEEWAEPDQGGGEIVLGRTVGADGRSSARVGGRLAPVSTLAAIGAGLVEIHGQHQAERLLTPAAQLEFLDRYLGRAHLEELRRYRDRHRDLERTRAALDELERGVREREREKDLLSYQIREIEGAGVTVGERALLSEEESRLAHAERILGHAGRADHVLGEEGGAADLVREAFASIQSAATLDGSARPLAERLASLVAEMEDQLGEIRRYRESVQVDPVRLDQVRERLQALTALERKYGDGEQGILSYLEAARAGLAALAGEGEARADLDRRAVSLGEEVAAAAAGLTARRAAGPPRLSAALTGQVRQLGMPGAAVAVELAPRGEPGPDGSEGAEFRFSGSAEQPALPLSRAASGGELSRVMLACRSVLADLDDVPTLVFDEVDSGIGGRTARAVAARLAGLARSRQVVVVTHLAQIAARADRQFVVTKEGGVALVRPVDGEDRVEELARMLSGTTGEVSLAHARELIDSGGAARTVRAGAGGGGAR